MPVSSNFKFTSGAGGPFGDQSKLHARIVQLLKIDIVIRTQNMGIDVGGKPFVPYASKYYVQERAAAGRAPYPNLTFTGRMIQNLQKVDETPTSVSIGFTGEQLKKAAINNERREFMGLNAKREKIIIDTTNEWIAEELGKL